MNLLKIISFCLICLQMISCNYNKQDSQKKKEEEEQKPNIILFLVDDLGYTDVGTFAKKITGVPQKEQFYETPNIGRLASEGISFSQAYACPLCAPTRSSILTGKYASKLGFMTATGSGEEMFYAKGIKPPEGFSPYDELWKDNIPIEQAVNNGYTNIALPSGNIGDDNNETTLAEMLKGYNSAFLGKWHVGGHGVVGHQPKDQGFQEIAYFDAGGSPYYNWRKLWDTSNPYPTVQKVAARGKSGEPTGKDYLTDDLTEQALRFIDKQTENKNSQPFFLDFCEFAVHAPLQAPKELTEYFDSKRTKGWNGHHNPVYAAMIKKLDESVGKIMDKLKEKGIEENTIIVFMSDNGGVTWNTHNPADTTATTSNAPLKGGKAMLYEGGIRVPLIIWQKGKIPAGIWSNTPVDCNDIYPTLAQMSNSQYNHNEIDGYSLKSLFKDPHNAQENYKRTTFYWHYPLNVIVKNPDDGYALTPQSAIRKGDYKLIFDWYGRLKLYNIKQDISEKNNLAFKKPDITRALFKDLITWLDNNVKERYLPVPNPKYNPAKEVRKVPYVNLYQAYKQNKDIIKLAH